MVSFPCEFCKEDKEYINLSSALRSKHNYCNTSCQNKAEKLRGIDKTIKAHQMIRDKGHYKRDNSYLIGENNPAWKGDKASYTAIHHWVYRHKGDPKKCSYNLLHKGPYFWCNISGEYKRDISDWHDLCNSCNQKDGIRIHKRFLSQ